MTRSTARTAPLVMVVVVVSLLAACGGDDSTAAKSSDSTSSTTMAMGDHTAPATNPCAPGGSGQLPGMGGTAPVEGAAPVTITATEYLFGGTDALKAGGKFAITFENTGKELHELAITKLPDDEKRPLDEVMKDSTTEDKVAQVAGSFACPGTTTKAVGADLTDAGRYIVSCFIPTGAMPDTDPATFDKLGPPHALQGMVVEIDIA